MNFATARGMLRALAAGDALGMPTEFMGRREIARRFGMVDRLLDPAASKLHRNLPRASVTDDTEQVLWLLDGYLREGISAEGTTRLLLEWVRETKADERGYIGPTSLKALRAIEAGTDPLLAGKGGNTCGGMLRAPAVVLASGGADEGELFRRIEASCLPTHNSAAALEAAAAYGFALRAAADGATREGVLEAALRGARAGAAGREDDFPPPSSAARIRLLADTAPGWKGPEEAMEFLHDVLGCGLPSWETCPAVFGVFLHAGRDSWLAVRMGASLGGDTDTVAALAGALSAAWAGEDGIPGEIMDAVLAANGLDLDGAARRAAGAG